MSEANSTLGVNIQVRKSGFELTAQFETTGGVTALFGHSGAGKSTIVNAIAGLATPDQGKISIGGTVVFEAGKTNLPPHMRRVGMVFQDARLFPHLNVARNLTYGQWAGGRHGNTKLDDIVELLGLENVLARSPASLSGGEKQRVAIGRALLADPAILLLDEPLASLDQNRRQDILPFLENVRDHSNIPIVYVSHDLDEVARLADTVIVLSHGKLLGYGPAIEMFARMDFGPALGRHEASTLLEGTVVEPGGSTGLATISLHPDNSPSGQLRLVSSAVSKNDRVRLRVRARDVSLALEHPGKVSIRNVIPAIVKDLHVDESSYVEVLLETHGQPLRARVTRDAMNDLGLVKGLELFALIKSAAIDRRSVAGR